jgi:plastocyanin
MKSSKSLIIGIAVAVIVIAGGIVFAMNGKSKTTDTMASSASSSSASDTSKAVATDVVAIKDYVYSPAVATVKVGTKVTWTNKDAVHHSVTADAKSSNAPDGGLFGQDETFSYTFQTAGTYMYHCIAHPEMHGSVVVTN